MSTDNQIEQEIQAKGLTAPRIKPSDIEANIVSEHYFTAGDGFAGALSVSPEFNELPDNERVISPPPELDMVTICVLITKERHQVGRREHRSGVAVELQPGAGSQAGPPGCDGPTLAHAGLRIA